MSLTVKRQIHRVGELLCKLYEAIYQLASQVTCMFRLLKFIMVVVKVSNCPSTHNGDEFESMRYSKLQCICFQAYNRIRYIAVKIGISRNFRESKADRKHHSDSEALIKPVGVSS